MEIIFWKARCHIKHVKGQMTNTMQMNATQSSTDENYVCVCKWFGMKNPNMMSEIDIIVVVIYGIYFNFYLFVDGNEMVVDVCKWMKWTGGHDDDASKMTHDTNDTQMNFSFNLELQSWILFCKMFFGMWIKFENRREDICDSENIKKFKFHHNISRLFLPNKICLAKPFVLN